MSAEREATPLVSARFPKTNYRDKPFAIAFCVHLCVAVVVVLSDIPLFKNVLSGQTDLKAPNVQLTDEQIANVGILVGVVLACGVVGCFATLAVIRRFAASIFAIMFGCQVLLALLAPVALFAAGAVPAAMGFAVASALYLALLSWFWCIIKPYVPWAQACLQVAVKFLQEHGGYLPCLSLFLLVPQLLWSTMGGLAAAAYFETATPATDPQTGQEYLQLPPEYAAKGGFIAFSLLWVMQVLANVMHTTVAGAFSGWWFGGGGPNLVSGALRRATTTSFGSICFGSLLVAIVSMVRRALQGQRGKGGGGNPIAACILACLEQLIQWFNKWAFCYVAIYGKSFIDSGKAVFELFKSKGLDMILSENVVGYITGFAVFSNGVIAALVTGLCAFAIFPNTPQAVGVAAVLAFFVGVVIGSTVMAIIDSCIHTLLVCFAEEPEALYKSNPEVYKQLAAAWNQIYGVKCFAVNSYDGSP